MPEPQPLADVHLQIILLGDDLIEYQGQLFQAKELLYALLRSLNSLQSVAARQHFQGQKTPLKDDEIDTQSQYVDCANLLAQTD